MSFARRAPSTGQCVLACLLAAACGGDVKSDAGGSAGASGVGAHAGSSGSGGTGGSGGSTSFDITVLDQKEQPIAGAIVVVDKPGGAQEETTTNELGVATFAPVDFGAGTIDVWAFSPQRVLVTLLDVGASTSRVVHLVPRIENVYQGVFKKQLVLHFSNKKSSADCVTFASSIPQTLSLATTLSCEETASLWLPAGATGKIVALEHAALPPPVPPDESSAGPLPPIKAAVVIDIPSSGVDVDFSQSLPVEHASGSLELPVPDNGMKFKPSELGVGVYNSEWHGWPTLALSTSSPGTGPAPRPRIPRVSAVERWPPAIREPTPHHRFRSPRPSSQGTTRLRCFRRLPGRPVPIVPIRPSLPDSSGSTAGGLGSSGSLPSAPRSPCANRRRASGALGT